MANMLKNFDIASLDPFGVERAHIEAEISKLAYDARNRLIADPTVTDGTERMLSTELANELSALISKTKVNKRVSEITEAVHKDTVYISVVDRDRMSVSLSIQFSMVSDQELQPQIRSFVPKPWCRL